MNVILIISDTFRRDHLGCYGNSWMHTPHLDALAAESVLFEQAWTGSFPTVPNRHDLLTGRWTFTYKPWSPLDADTETLPLWLGRAGVLTFGVVDTPHHFAPGYNYQRDFRAWQVIRGQEAEPYETAPREVPLPCPPEKMRQNGELYKQYLRNVHLRRTEEDYFPAQTMRTAARWLEENYRERFFLYVDTFDPHEPWDPPQYYVDRYDPGYTGQVIPHPSYDRADLLTPAERRHQYALYAGEATMVDRWIGFLLDRVETLGIAEQTAIIFTTDHGFYLGEHGWIAKSLIRGSLYQHLPLYPEVAHIPLMIRVPGVAPRRTAALAQPVDLPATILELMATPQPEQVEGHSLLPLVRGEQDSVRELAISSPNVSVPGAPQPFATARSTVTDGEWLLIVGPDVPPMRDLDRVSAVDSISRGLTQMEPRGQEPQLYHLPSDPGCERNILADNAEVSRRLYACYLTFLRKHGVPEAHLQFFPATLP